MLGHLLWTLAGVVGAVAAWVTARRLLVDEWPPAPAWGRLDTRARIGAARDLGRYGARVVAVVVVGVFCGLVAVSAVFSMVTGGA